MELSSRDLIGVGRRVARQQEAALDEAALLGADERLAAIRRRGPARAKGWRRGRAMLLFAAALLSCAIALVMVGRREPAVSYRIGDTVGAPGQWVGSDEAPVSLTFSEGSRVDVKRGARARVTQLGAARVHLVVERGSLHVSVVPREDNDWVIVGGPFAVHVVGTEFDVAWDPSTEELAVAMASGSVRIEGPCIEPATRSLAAPESVRLTCSRAARAEDRPAQAETAEERESEAPAASAAPSASGAARAPRFETASGHELCELGSAARLAGDAAEARRYYEAARRRFPGSDAAAIAAYHLGRMAFDGQGAWAEAERWFALYLAERPGGALAAEALGRSMESAHARGDAARARELAERYLAAYPNGPQAALAARLSESEP